MPNYVSEQNKPGNVQLVRCRKCAHVVRNGICPYCSGQVYRDYLEYLVEKKKDRKTRETQAGKYVLKEDKRALHKLLNYDKKKKENTTIKKIERAKQYQKNKRECILYISRLGLDLTQEEIVKLAGLLLANWSTRYIRQFVPLNNKQLRIIKNQWEQHSSTKA